MKKLVCGVGVNDLGYRVHVREELPKKMEAKEAGRLFFYAHTMKRGEAC